MKTKPFLTPLYMALIGVMTALGTVIYMFFPEIPLVPGVEYLKIDFSDIPAILLGVTVHPVCGILVEVFKNLVHLLRTTTMGIGELMNIGIGTVVILSLWGSQTLAAKALRRDKWQAAPYFIGAAVTVVAAILGGWAFNWLLTPVFYKLMGFPLTPELLWAGVFGSTALNAVKAAINVLPFYPLYLAVHKVLSRMR